MGALAGCGAPSRRLPWRSLQPLTVSGPNVCLGDGDRSASPPPSTPSRTTSRYSSWPTASPIASRVSDHPRDVRGPRRRCRLRSLSSPSLANSRLGYYRRTNGFITMLGTGVAVRKHLGDSFWVGGSLMRALASPPSRACSPQPWGRCRRRSPAERADRRDRSGQPHAVRDHRREPPLHRDRREAGGATRRVVCARR